MVNVPCAVLIVCFTTERTLCPTIRGWVRLLLLAIPSQMNTEFLALFNGSINEFPSNIDVQPETTIKTIISWIIDSSRFFVGQRQFNQLCYIATSHQRQYLLRKKRLATFWRYTFCMPATRKRIAILLLPINFTMASML